MPFAKFLLLLIFRVREDIYFHWSGCRSPVSRSHPVFWMVVCAQWVIAPIFKFAIGNYRSEGALIVVFRLIVIVLRVIIVIRLCPHTVIVSTVIRTVPVVIRLVRVVLSLIIIRLIIIRCILLTLSAIVLVVSAVIVL